MLICLSGRPGVAEEIVTGQETSTNQMPAMSEFTRSGGTSIGTGAGCSSGEYCTAGKQGPGGTYTTTFDLEDAMAIRNMKDVNQAERLLILRRKKRMKVQQEQAAQNSQTQSQSAMQAQQQSAQAAQQQTQLEAQVKQQEMQMKHQYEMQLLQAKHEMNKELEIIKAQATLGFREDDQNFKEKIEVMKEQNKSERQDKQLEANEQAEPQG